jgi:hypothetical protein
MFERDRQLFAALEINILVPNLCTNHHPCVTKPKVAAGSS